MKLQRSNFGLVALFLLLTIACLGACSDIDADKYILTNKDGDTIMIQEGMQPDTFYARGYKTFNMKNVAIYNCLLYTSPSPRDSTSSRMPSSA